jgi:hypothetical protein
MTAITLAEHWIQYGNSFSAKAGAAIKEPFACVKLDTTAGQVIETDAADLASFIGFIRINRGWPTYDQSDEANGSATNAVDAGDRIEVYYTGIVWAVTGTGYNSAAGVYLTSAADGKVGAASSSDLIVGKAMVAANGANILIPVLICHGSGNTTS